MLNSGAVLSARSRMAPLNAIPSVPHIQSGRSYRPRIGVERSSSTRRQSLAARWDPKRGGRHLRSTHRPEVRRTPRWLFPGYRLRCSSPAVQCCCRWRSEEHTSELQSRLHLVCRLLLEKKKKKEISCLSTNTRV